MSGIFEAKRAEFRKTLQAIVDLIKSGRAKSLPTLDVFYHYDDGFHFVSFSFVGETPEIRLKYNEPTSELDSISADLWVNGESVCSIEIDEDDAMFNDIKNIFVEEERQSTKWSDALDKINNALSFDS